VSTDVTDVFGEAEAAFDGVLATVPFVQFMRPGGQRVPNSVERSPEIAAKARALIEAGCELQCEVLTTGQVFMDCVSPDDEQLANELVGNGPETLPAVDRLVEAAHARLFG
jgi:hypothetical protein